LFSGFGAGKSAGAVGAAEVSAGAPAGGGSDREQAVKPSTKPRTTSTWFDFIFMNP